MDQLGALVDRRYHLFDYAGHPEAERVIVAIGSGAEVAHEAVDWLNSRGHKVGALKVRLYRPWSTKHFVAALPKMVKQIAVLDRTKEPGAPFEPLHGDVIAALREGREDGLTDLDPRVIGGGDGASSQGVTPPVGVGGFSWRFRKKAR